MGSAKGLQTVPIHPPPNWPHFSTYSAYLSMNYSILAFDFCLVISIRSMGLLMQRKCIMYFYFCHHIPIEQVARSKWCTMLVNFHETSTLLLAYKLSHIKHLSSLEQKLGPVWQRHGGLGQEGAL